MPDEKKDIRIPIMMSRSEVEAIDRWRYENRIPTRAEAIRRMIDAALNPAEDDQSNVTDSPANPARGRSRALAPDDEHR